MLIDNTEEVAQNKLLLLYIIKLSPNSFTKEELTEFILEKNYMNYFFIQQYIGELLENQFIEISQDGVQKFLLLPKGETTLNYFENKISDTIKDELDKVFKIQEIITKKSAQVIAEYYQKENTDQYIVNLKLVENEETLFSLYFEVPSQEQSEIICSNWKENTEVLYQNIINMFI